MEGCSLSRAVSNSSRERDRVNFLSFSYYCCEALGLIYLGKFLEFKWMMFVKDLTLMGIWRFGVCDRFLNLILSFLFV